MFGGVERNEEKESDGRDKIPRGVVVLGEG